jgi:hypothetical protein
MEGSNFADVLTSLQIFVNFEDIFATSISRTSGLRSVSTKMRKTANALGKGLKVSG